MPINVVCPGCKKRFAVSEKYAGKKGPCPHCKSEITIPALEEQVVIHAPEAAGPTDSKGAAVIKPLARQETRFDPKVAVGIGVLVIAVFIAAWIVGASYKPKGVKGKPSAVPLVYQAIAALALAPPLVFAGYTFLRNDEFEPYRGQALWLRVAICAAVYAVLWGVYSMLPWALGIKGFDTVQLTYIVPPFIVAGAFTALASLEFDFVTGAMHYGLYLIVTVLLRVVAQLNAF